jgi:Methyltransferase domain
MTDRILGIEELLGGNDEWRMSLGERAALEGILASLEPSTAIEIGTLQGGSLETIAAYGDIVHSFDLSFHPSVSSNRFPNVVFHEGDSHILLPEVLRELAAAGTNVDLVLVDGDHTAAGVGQDLEDLLDSPSVGRTIILIHDTLNERVRMGLHEVDFDRPKVTHVELDFVVGRIWGGASFDHDLWGGLGLVVTGWELDRDVVADTRPLYDAVDVFATFRRTLEGGGTVEAPPYGEIRVLEHQLSELRGSMALMERSLSWRITAPLRRVRSLVRR